jgi:hypothetical protein
MTKEMNLYEAANIHPKDTGLKTSIFSLHNGKEENLLYEPRVDVTTLHRGRLPIQLMPKVRLAVNENLRILTCTVLKLVI